MTLASVLGGVGVVVVPKAIRAGTTQEAVSVTPRDEGRRVVWDAIRAFFEMSQGVLGVWERPGGGFDMALLHGNRVSDGRVHERDVVLIGWSPTLGTLAAYMSGGKGGAEEGLAVEIVGGDEALDPWLWSGDVEAEGFAARWRARPGIERRVIAAGLWSVRVTPGEDSQGLETIGVELVWDERSPDEERDRGEFEVTLRQGRDAEP